MGWGKMDLEHFTFAHVPLTTFWQLLLFQLWNGRFMASWIPKKIKLKLYFNVKIDGEEMARVVWCIKRGRLRWNKFHTHPFSSLGSSLLNWIQESGWIWLVAGFLLVWLPWFSSSSRIGEKLTLSLVNMTLEISGELSPCVWTVFAFTCFKVCLTETFMIFNNNVQKLLGIRTTATYGKT